MREDFNRFTAAQMPEGRLVPTILQEHGLPETASQEEILPVASELWNDPNKKLTALELLVGRRIDAEEIANGDDLVVRGAYLMPDAPSALDYIMRARQ